MSSIPTERTPATACPLCGQANACAVEARRATGVAQPPCWCMTASFPPELLSRVPEALRNQACICAACVQGARR